MGRKGKKEKEKWSGRVEREKDGRVMKENEVAKIKE